MKKYLIFASAAIVALASCAKEIKVQEPVNNNDEVILTFTSVKPELESKKEVATRTAWDNTNSCVVWSSTDKIRVGFKKDGSWWSQNAAADATAEPATHPKFYASNEVTIDDNNDASVGTFAVPISNSAFTDLAESGSYQFFAVYPNSLMDATVNNPAAKNITIKETQSPSSNTFDAAADVLLGQSDPMSISGLPTDPIELNWTRVVAHAALTFSNMAFVGAENVSKVTLTFNDDAKVTGTVSANIEAGTIGSGSSNVLILDDGFTVSSNSISVWACVLPVTFTSLDVEVKTDKATYTRSITGISKTFKKNAKNDLTINMATADREEVTPDEYALYSGSISEGDYVIYYNGKAMKAAVSSNRLQYAEVTPSNDIISTNDELIVWHIAASDTYWTLYNASEAKYAAATGSKNQAQLLADGTDDRSLWTVSGSDTYDFENKARAAAANDSSNKWLRNNGTYGFACYKDDTGAALSLYKKDTRTRISAPATVSAALNSSDESQIDVSFATVSGAASYVIVATPEAGAPVTKGVATSPASISVADGLAYSTTYYISVYAVPSNNTYRNSVSKQATGTVTTGAAPAANYDFTSIAELNDLAGTLSNNETADYEGYLSNVIVSYKPNDSNAIIKDASASILVYAKSGHGLLQGQTFTGNLNVTVTMYYTTIEVTSIDATFEGAGSSVAPANMTLDQLVGNFTTYQNAYVQVDNLTVTGRDGKNISVRNSANTKTYIVYDNANTSPATTGDVISVVGTVGDYSGTNQIKAWTSSDITITATSPKAITFSQPTGAAGTAGCSFMVSVGGSPITSGDTVASGTTVTLTATEGTDYEFTSWTVTGATVADASASTTTFTMGTSPVSISATFTSTGGGEPTEKVYYILNTATTAIATGNSYNSYENQSCATGLASPGSYPSTATWSVTCGSKQTNSPAGLWLGSNNNQKAKMILSTGSITGASAIASAIGVTTSATYYAAMICHTAFANITRVVLERNSTGGTAPSDVYLLRSTDGGTTYTLVERKADAASLTFTIASPAASAIYAIAIHCTGYCQYKVPVVTFYTTDNN